MSEQTLIVSILSKERLSGNSSNFLINILPAITRIKKIELINVTMINGFYNIITGLNDIISFSDGAGGHSYTIPAGGYNAIDLASNIQTGFQAINGAQNYLVSISVDTGKTTFSATGNFSLLWSSGVATNPSDLLGFTLADNTGTNTYTSAGCFKSQLYDVCYINIDKLGNIGGRSARYANDTFTFKIPINVNFSETISWNPLTNAPQILYYPATVDLSSINVSLYTTNGTALSLNSVDWSLDLRCHF